VRPLPAALLAAALLAGCGGEQEEERPERAEAPAARAPEPPAEPREAGTPAAAPVPDGRWPTAEVRRRTWLRAAPGGRRVARIGRKTAFGGPNVLAVARRRGRWVAVHAPERPNRRPGWLPASAVRFGAVDLSIHVDRSARRLSVRDGKRVLRRFTVAVGRPGHETPLGRYGVTDKLLMPAGTPYGCCAVALSGHQTSLPSGWGGGDRLAVHGTTAPETIGQAASLGCMRAAEADLRWMLRRLPLGAPVFVRA
jgi:L,D-transpeptidase catalytic domain